MGIGNKVYAKVQGHKGKLWRYGIKTIVDKTFGNFSFDLVLPPCPRDQTNEMTIFWIGCKRK